MGMTYSSFGLPVTTKNLQPNADLDLEEYDLICDEAKGDKAIFDDVVGVRGVFTTTVSNNVNGLVLKSSGVYTVTPVGTLDDSFFVPYHAVEYVPQENASLTLLPHRPGCTYTGTINLYHGGEDGSFTMYKWDGSAMRAQSESISTTSAGQVHQITFTEIPYLIVAFDIGGAYARIGDYQLS